MQLVQQSAHQPLCLPPVCPAHTTSPAHTLQVFVESSLPVIQHYEVLGKVARINADRPAEDIYKEVRRLFMEL